jgi:putative ATP-dependent endonuclease of OLD family
MQLNSFKIHNFRKFREQDNVVHFVNSQTITSVEPTEEENSLIGSSGTLIIGKNNAGKTTIANALMFICAKQKPVSSDFNIDYLRDLLQTYISAKDAGESFDELNTPSLEFVIQVKVNFEENGDVVNNLYQFVPISTPTSDLINIKIKYQVKEEQELINNITTILNIEYQNIDDSRVIFNNRLIAFREILNLDTTDFDIIYLTSSNDEVKSPNLEKLFNIKEIKANRHLKDGVLSDIYKKIVSSQYIGNDTNKEILQRSITSINEEIKLAVGPKSTSISSILQEIEQSNHVGVDLSGNVTEEAILRHLIKYSFSDGDDYIPEEQFGLGYINLLNIIGEIIHYIDNYKDKSHQNQINLLFIEEPEAFMHPQMQEFFITRIDRAVKKTLQIANLEAEDLQKSLQCQLVITTHSSHIVNSKIHSSNSFDNINYLNSINRQATVVNLNDKLVAGEGNSTTSKSLKFIKKHIKYKVSELFFSDAVIFVEGITEETLLNYYIDQNLILKNYYISIFNINGAHGKLYFPLAKALKIPCLVITDIDIKRAKCEKGDKNNDHQEDVACHICGKEAGAKTFTNFTQITSLNGRITTNSTLSEFNQTLRGKSEDDSYSLENSDYFEDDNLHIIFQKDEIEGQYATSFEEAFILENYENNILNSVLKKCKPNIYKEIVGSTEPLDKHKLVENSFKLQKKLSDSKSDFANNLLFECITSDEVNKPDLPLYIKHGFSWLSNKLSPELVDELSPELVDEVIDADA